jgi:predicted acyl esterase
MLHWFDHELKQLNVTTGPAVQVLDSECRWRNEEHFPPHDAKWVTYHLDGGNKLSTAPGASGAVLLTPAALIPTGGPLDGVKSLPGYKADFSTAPLETPMQISGLPRLHITVTPHTEGGQIAAWMYDVDGAGKEKRIGWTTMNLLYADGGDQPKPIVPNMPIIAKLQFEPMDAYVQAGHRILIRLWDSPYSDHIASVPPAPVTVNYGGSAKSVLELGTVARPDSVFFVPPQPNPDAKLNKNSGPGSE